MHLGGRGGVLTTGPGGDGTWTVVRADGGVPRTSPGGCGMVCSGCGGLLVIGGDGVHDGVRDGVHDGVRDSVRDGVRNGVRDGVRDSVRADGGVLRTSPTWWVWDGLVRHWRSPHNRSCW